MRLIRLISCVADWADERQIRVDYVVPHKIGLDRAQRQFEQLSDQAKRASNGLVDLSVVADTVNVRSTASRTVASSLSAPSGSRTISTPIADPHEPRQSQ